jgi:hypothetical protein
LSGECELNVFLFCSSVRGFLLSEPARRAQGASRWATPMKAIDMTVFLFELGIRFAKSPVAVRGHMVRVAASRVGEFGVC